MTTQQPTVSNIYPPVDDSLNDAMMKEMNNAIPLDENPSASYKSLDEILRSPFASEFDIMPDIMEKRLEEVVMGRFGEYFGKYGNFRSNPFMVFKMKDRVMTIISPIGGKNGPVKFEQSELLILIPVNTARMNSMPGFIEQSECMVVPNYWFQNQAPKPADSTDTTSEIPPEKQAEIDAAKAEENLTPVIGGDIGAATDRIADINIVRRVIPSNPLQLAMQNPMDQVGGRTFGNPSPSYGDVEPPPPLEYEENASALAGFLAEALSEVSEAPMVDPTAVNLTEGSFFVKSPDEVIPGTRPSILMVSNYVSPWEKNSYGQYPINTQYSNQHNLKTAANSLWAGDDLQNAYASLGAQPDNSTSWRYSDAENKISYLETFKSTLASVSNYRQEYDDYLDGTAETLRMNLKWEGYPAGQPLGSILMQNLLDLCFYCNVGGKYPLTRTETVTQEEVTESRGLALNYKVNLSGAYNTFPDPSSISCKDFFGGSLSSADDAGKQSEYVWFTPPNYNMTDSQYNDFRWRTDAGYNIMHTQIEGFIDAIENYYDEFAVPFMCNTIWVEWYISCLLMVKDIYPSNLISSYFTDSVLDKVQQQTNIMAGVCDLDLASSQLSKDVHDWTTIAMPGQPDLPSLIKYDQSGHGSSGSTQAQYIYAFQADDMLQGIKLNIPADQLGGITEQSAGTAWITPTILASLLGDFGSSSSSGVIDTGRNTDDNLISKDILIEKFLTEYNIDLAGGGNFQSPGFTAWANEFERYYETIEHATRGVLDTGGGAIVYAVCASRLLNSFYKYEDSTGLSFWHEDYAVRSYHEAHRDYSIFNIFRETQLLGAMSDAQDALYDGYGNNATDVFNNLQDYLEDVESDLEYGDDETNDRVISLNIAVLLMKLLWGLNSSNQRQLFRKILETIDGPQKLTWGDCYDLFELLINPHEGSSYGIGSGGMGPDVQTMYETGYTGGLTNERIGLDDWFHRASGAANSTEFDDMRDQVPPWYLKSLSPIHSAYDIIYQLAHIIRGVKTDMQSIVLKNLEDDGHITSGMHSSALPLSYQIWLPNEMYGSQYLKEESGVTDKRSRYREISSFSMDYIILKTLCRIGVNFVSGMLNDGSTLNPQWEAVLKPDSFKVAEAMMYEHQLVYSTHGYSGTGVQSDDGYGSGGIDTGVSSPPSAEANADMLIAQRDAIEQSLNRPEFRFSMESSGESIWGNALKEFRSQFYHMRYTDGLDGVPRHKMSTAIYEWDLGEVTVGFTSKTESEAEDGLTNYYASIVDEYSTSNLDGMGYYFEDALVLADGE